MRDQNVFATVFLSFSPIFGNLQHLLINKAMPILIYRYYKQAEVIDIIKDMIIIVANIVMLV